MSGFHIVFIRGIGGPSHALITMKELEQAVMGAGVGEVRSVLATGNFVVRSKLPASIVAKHFDQAMRKKGLERPLVTRSPLQLKKVMYAGASHPAVAARPSRVLVHFFEKAVRDAAVADINARVSIENAFMLGDELVVDFSDGISASKLTLEFFERCAGSMGTGRNWNTVGKVLDAAIAMGWSY